MESIASLFDPVEETESPETSTFSGSLPSWLEGSFLQIGPGLLDLSPEVSLQDWLDGYGIVSKFTLSPSHGTVTLEKKFVRSESLRQALDKGRPQFTEYGTIAAQFDKDKGLLSKIVSSIKEDMSDNSSASLYCIGPHMVASSSTYFFHQLDPITLSTGERFDGRKIFGQNGLGVHPIVDKENGFLWNMGFTVIPFPKFNIFKLKIPPGNGVGANLGSFLEHTKPTLVASISSRWKGAIAFNHSFGMSSSYVVLVEQPYVILVSRVLSSKIKGLPVKDWLEWRPQEGNVFHILDKRTGKVISGGGLEIRSETPFFFLHFANCFEEEGRLVVDILTAPNPSSTEASTLSKLRKGELDGAFVKEGLSTLQRFIIPLSPEVLGKVGDGTVVEAAPTAYQSGNKLFLRPQNMSPLGIDRFSINEEGVRGRPYSYLYGSGSFLTSVWTECPFANSICKIDLSSLNLNGRGGVEVWKRWTGGSKCFPSEPLFVSKGGGGVYDEDDGVILCAVETVGQAEGGENFFLVLDAKSMEELGRARFKTKFSGALHGIFLRS